MNALALGIGGIVPALLLGVGTVLMRCSIGNGASVATYVATVGTTIAVVGWLASAVAGGVTGGGRAIGAAVAMGLTWSVAIACMSYGFGTLKLPISIVAPLTNSNALIAVALGALLFAEYKDLDMGRVLIGTLLICAGATLVSLSKAS
jgi:transporter family protein